jgi:hypothetical protein
MFLGEAIYASKILEHPEAMDLVEDPYVIVIEDPVSDWSLKPYKFQDMVSVMTLMHARGWETVNVTFSPARFLVALLKNPRAKFKNQG